jgi:hypothetical protein
VSTSGERGRIATTTGADSLRRRSRTSCRFASLRARPSSSERPAVSAAAGGERWSGCRAGDCRRLAPPPPRQGCSVCAPVLLGDLRAARLAHVARQLGRRPRGGAVCSSEAMGVQSEPGCQGWARTSAALDTSTGSEAPPRAERAQQSGHRETAANRPLRRTRAAPFASRCFSRALLPALPPVLWACRVRGHG